MNEYELIRPIEVLNLSYKTYDALKACKVNTVKDAVDFIENKAYKDLTNYTGRFGEPLKFGRTRQKDLKDALETYFAGEAAAENVEEDVPEYYEPEERIRFKDGKIAAVYIGGMERENDPPELKSWERGEDIVLYLAMVEKVDKPWRESYGWIEDKYLRDHVLWDDSTVKILVERAIMESDVMRFVSSKKPGLSPLAIVEGWEGCEDSEESEICIEDCDLESKGHRISEGLFRISQEGIDTSHWSNHRYFKDLRIAGEAIEDYLSSVFGTEDM